MSSTSLRFEDLRVGQVFTTRFRIVDAAEIQAFAERYDDQPLHTDPVYAGGGPFRRIIASGFQTIAVVWGLWIEALPFDPQAALGGVALDDVRWHEPLYPGESVGAEVTVAETRSTAKGKGLVTLDFRGLDTTGRELVTFRTVGLMALSSRTVGAEADGSR